MKRVTAKQRAFTLYEKYGKTLSKELIADIVLAIETAEREARPRSSEPPALWPWEALVKELLDRSVYGIVSVVRCDDQAAGYSIRTKGPASLVYHTISAADVQAQHAVKSIHEKGGDPWKQPLPPL